MVDRIRWKFSLRRDLESDLFIRGVNSFLDDIGKAKDYPARMAAAGVFGGYLRSCRSSVRQRLGEEMLLRLEEHGLVITQTVAAVALRDAFGLAAATAVLQRKFAEPGRNAHVKHVAAARAVMSVHGETIEYYAAIYEWYCDALARTIKRIRVQRRGRKK